MWFFWGVISALVSAVSIVINKRVLKDSSVSVTTWALFALSFPFLLVIAYFSDRPTIASSFYLGVIGSGVVFTVGKMLYMLMMKRNDLSKIIPLNSFNGVFLYLLALLFLGEVIAPLPLIGLLVVLSGAYLLNVQDRKIGIFKPITHLVTNIDSRIFLFANLLSAVSAVFDKVALKSTTPSSPIFVAVWENAIIAGILSIYLIIQKRGWISELIANFKPLFLASSVYALVVITTFLGFADGPIALVSGVKRLQILIVLLFSFVFFKDKPTKAIIVSSIVMLLGTVLIRLGGN